MMRTLSRRGALALLAGTAAVAATMRHAFGQRAMPTRTIASTGETLPVIGLGSTRPVTEIAQRGPAPVAAVIRALVEHGGRVVDTWPRSEANDGAFGSIIDTPELRDRLFVTINLEQEGRQAAIEHFERTLALYRRERIDLVNVGSLTDLDTHWPTLRAWKDAGRARYIGVTAARAELYDRLDAFLKREKPDFVEINYSVTERETETRFLPVLADRGIATLISRPFMNGAYFDKLKSVPLPEWTREFDCTSWAQFSLQYILANPHVTCVLTETTSAQHMAENALAAFAPVPGDAARERMRALIDAL
jgi:diketogulonate reductase-like aldo/keto reductase